MFEQIFMRPEWTCGRYDRESTVAIFYNLLEGLSYFFEDSSAMVVGEMLSYPRNVPFSILELSEKTSASCEVLLDFCNELAQYGLLTNEVPSAETIAEYRHNVVERHKCEVAAQVDTMKRETQLSHSDAELSYMERSGKITSVMFELTYNCSEKCLHCYNPGAIRNEDDENRRGKREELVLEDYIKLIDSLVEQGLSKVCLTGGDPFSKPHVWEILEYLYHKEVAFDLFTNGINAIDDVDRLAKLYPRSVGISLYSTVSETHDMITRRKGSCEITKTFIERCGKQGIPMHLKCCIMRPNVSNYYTVRDFALKVGALPQFDLNITDSVDGDACASKMLSLPTEMMEVVLCDDSLPYYINGKGVAAIKPTNKDERLCNAGKGNFCITPEGNVQPCCAFPLYLGNVKEIPITDIVEQSIALKEWKETTSSELEECYKHPYCIFCQMCVGNNFIAHGTVLKASPNNCRLAQERYNLALKMEKGYNPLMGKNLYERLADFKYISIRLNRIHTTNYRDNHG